MMVGQQNVKELITLSDITMTTF